MRERPGCRPSFFGFKDLNMFYEELNCLVNMSVTKISESTLFQTVLGLSGLSAFFRRLSRPNAICAVFLLNALHKKLLLAVLTKV